MIDTLRDKTNRSANKINVLITYAKYYLLNVPVQLPSGARSLILCPSLYLFRPSKKICVVQFTPLKKIRVGR